MCLQKRSWLSHTGCMTGRRDLFLPKQCGPLWEDLLPSRKGVWDLFGGNFLMRSLPMREWAAVIWPRKHSSTSTFWAWLPLLNRDAGDCIDLYICHVSLEPQGCWWGTRRSVHVTESLVEHHHCGMPVLKSTRPEARILMGLAYRSHTGEVKGLGFKTLSSWWREITDTIDEKEGKRGRSQRLEGVTV